MYTIVHHYLTVGDDDQPVVEVETRHTDDPEAIPDHVRTMILSPGGRSGTTVSLVVSRNQPTSL